MSQETLRVFVGTDDSQMVAARVLEHSIRKHASRPVEFTPMKDLPVPAPRDRKNRARTGFSFYRFLIPKLCNYRGRALYLDADMQVFADLAELWEIPFGHRKVLCTCQADIPAAWKDNPFFHVGRQFSVMLLECSRLDWEIESIIRGLDEGRYTYSQLLFELCLVKPDEIGDEIPPEWNRLEAYDPGKTKLLHYTVVPTQPWKSLDNPLRHVWLQAYREALHSGALAPAEVLSGIECGFLHPTLGDDLPAAAGTGQARPDRPGGDGPAVGEGLSRSGLEQALLAARAEAREARRGFEAATARIRELEAAVAGLRASWTWKVGRLVTGPLGRIKRSLGRPGQAILRSPPDHDRPRP